MSVREEIGKALRKSPKTCKQLGRDFGVDPRSIDNYRHERNMPAVPVFITMAREIPELKAKVLEWLDASTGDSGTDPARVLDDIQRLLSARR